MKKETDKIVEEEDEMAKIGRAERRSRSSQLKIKIKPRLGV